MVSDAASHVADPAEAVTTPSNVAFCSTSPIGSEIAACGSPGPAGYGTLPVLRTVIVYSTVSPTSTTSVSATFTSS